MHINTNRNVFNLIIIFSLINILGCDGGIFLRGYTKHSAKISGKISNATLMNSNEGNLLSDVKILLYTYHTKYLEDSVLNYKPNKEFLSDSLGYFEIYAGVPPSLGQFGAIITSKEGYLSDTIFFEFNSLDTINLVLNLEKK
jgi:hypothetical protein